MSTNKKQYFGGLDKNYFAGVQGQGGVNPYVTHTDPFKAAQLGAKGAPKTQRPQYTKEELDSMRADAYVARSIDGGPQINYEKYDSLPDTIFNGIESWKNSTSAQIGYNMAVQQDMGQTDFIGRAGKAGNINILRNQILTGVPNELKGLNDALAGYNEAADTGLLSSTMDPDLKMFYADLANGNNITDTRVENGNVIVNHATMGEMSMNQITKDAQENIVYKNYDTGNIMRKNLSSAYDRGQVLNSTEEALQRSQLNQKLSQQRKGGVVSAAFDDIMGFGTPLLNKSEYQKEFDILTKANQDPAAVAEAQKTLQDAVVDAYIVKMNNLAQQGSDVKKGIKRDVNGNIIPNLPSKQEVDLDAWYASFDTEANPGGVPTARDWRLQLLDVKGKEDTKWEDGFDIITREGSAGTRTFNITRGGKTYSYDESTFYTDKNYKRLFGYDIAGFEALPEDQRKKLKDDAGVSMVESGGSGGATYLVPAKMAASSERNKIDAGFKIDPSLNKDEIFDIINKLR